MLSASTRAVCLSFRYSNEKAKSRGRGDNVGPHPPTNAREEENDERRKPRDREKEGDGERQREVRRYSPKRHEEVPGGRAFLTSMFCFRKAAN